jgi:hypothetical protein
MSLSLVELVTSAIVKATILIITLVIFLVALHNSYIKDLIINIYKYIY